LSEALLVQDQDVYIIGGANSAGQAALYFAQRARNVTMLVRSDGLDKCMSRYLIDQIQRTPNIRVLTCCTVVEAIGAANLEALVLFNQITGDRTTVPASALFIFIGAVPCTSWLRDVLVLDEHGFVVSGPDLRREGKLPRGWTLDRDPYLLETSMPGVFVAGDTRHGSVKRVASAVGEGSISVQMIHQYLNKVR
jgi:thioredoxin reductase (NADPH)